MAWGIGNENEVARFCRPSVRGLKALHKAGPDWLLPLNLPRKISLALESSSIAMQNNQEAACMVCLPRHKLPSICIVRTRSSSSLDLTYSSGEKRTQQEALPQMRTHAIESTRCNHPGNCKFKNAFLVGKSSSSCKAMSPLSSRCVRIDVGAKV